MKVKTTKKYIELLITLSLTTLVSGCLSNADLKPETSKRVLDYPECNLSYKTYGVHGILTNANFNAVVNNCINQKEKKIEREKALDKNPICKKKFEYSHTSGIACSVKIENEKVESALAEKKRIYMESPEGKAKLELEAKHIREKTLAKRACEIENIEISIGHPRSTIRLTEVKKISKNTYRCSSWIDEYNSAQIKPTHIDATINIETGEYKEKFYSKYISKGQQKREREREREKALEKNPICKKKFEHSHASGIACSVKIGNEKTEAALAEKKNIYMESPKGKAELKSNKEFEAKEMREEALATKACEVKNREGSRSYSRSTIRLTGVKKISKNTYRCSSWIDDNSGSQIMPVRVNATINIETGEYKERRHH